MNQLIAIAASGVPPISTPNRYPEPFRSMFPGRVRRALGDAFGLRNFGVNMTHLAPGAVSTVRHAHSKQDEFVYVIQGAPLLHTNDTTVRLAPGDCCGFGAGTGNAHRLINDTTQEVVYLEVGDRAAGDEVTYPDDDLVAGYAKGQRVFFHKDGTPYPP